MKRVFFISFLIIASIIILFFFLSLFKNVSNKFGGFSPTPTPLYNSYLKSHYTNPNLSPSEAPTITQTAENGKIIIYGVSVKNFFTSPIQTNNQGDVLIVDNPDYQIAFLKPFQSFVITVLGSPFEQAREEAEYQFLQTLEITPEEACKLPITLGTPIFANPNEAGTKYKLSFCE